MKAFFTLLSVVLIAASANAQSKTLPDSTKKLQLVEASCGQCQFGMKDKKGCDLAVRIDGKAYFVDGTSIDQHGDAHAKDGFCEAIRMAEVQGEVVDGRFKASYFRLVKEEKKKKSGR